MMRALAFLIAYPLLFVPQAILCLWPFGAHLIFGWWSPLGTFGVWAIWTIPFGYCMYRLYGSLWWENLHKRVVSWGRGL